MADKARAIWQTPIFGVIILGLCVISFNNWILALFLNHTLLFKAGSVSELSAATQPHAWIFRCLDLLAGISMIALALLVSKKMGSVSKVGRWLIIATFILGIANVVDAILPLRCSETLEVNCVEPVNLSLSHFSIPSHGYSSVIISVGYFALPLLGFLYARRSGQRPFMLVSAITVAASIVSLFSAVTGYIITQSFSERALGPSQELQMLLLGFWFISWYLAVFAKSEQSI